MFRTAEARSGEMSETIIRIITRHCWCIDFGNGEEHCLICRGSIAIS